MMESNQNQPRARAKRSQVLTLILAGVCVVALCLFIHSFLSSNRNLSASIQSERMDYVAEISAQIISSQRFMEEQFTAAAENHAATLMHGGAETLDEARAQFVGQSYDNILLMSEEGRLIDLSGGRPFMTDRSLLERLAFWDGKTIQLFSSLNSAEDYWLFAAKLKDCVLDDTTYTAVILAIPAEEFRDSLAISMFDNRGASYIIQNDGAIKVKPGVEQSAFEGYNLFSVLVANGAAQDEVDRLQADMESQLSGSIPMTLDGQNWLMSHNSIDEATSIVIAVPLTITAAQTYDGLTDTILFAALIVAAMFGIVLLLFWFFFQRDRERSREAMAVAAKSDFFSKMSHDIRTPLNAIIGLETLARESIDDPEITAQYLAQSASSANYLLGIINDVLDMSRIESGKMTITAVPFDMNKLLGDVKNITETAAKEKGQSFILETDGPFETLYIGDQVRIKQIIMNLLSNAVKFSLPGGKVELRVSRAEDGDGDELTLLVRDRGIGMSRDYLSRIFTPFEQERSSYTESYGGSGLGLSIVHSLVTMMGGSIVVDSELGRGSAFTVKLRLPRGERLAETPAPELRSDRSFAGKRALLAEDNVVNQQVAVAILTKRFAMEAEIASNGKEAVDMMAASPEGYYDVVLMDVKMPVMDGLAAARGIRALKRNDADIPIIALSANAFAEDVALSLAAGMNAHLAKPIDISALWAQFDKYFKLKQEGQL